MGCNNGVSRMIRASSCEHPPEQCQILLTCVLRHAGQTQRVVGDGLRGPLVDERIDGVHLALALGAHVVVRARLLQLLGQPAGMRQTPTRARSASKQENAKPVRSKLRSQERQRSFAAARMLAAASHVNATQKQRQNQRCISSTSHAAHPSRIIIRLSSVAPPSGDPATPLAAPAVDASTGAVPEPCSVLRAGWDEAGGSGNGAGLNEPRSNALEADKEPSGAEWLSEEASTVSSCLRTQCKLSTLHPRTYRYMSCLATRLRAVEAKLANRDEATIQGRSQKVPKITTMARSAQQAEDKRKQYRRENEMCSDVL